MEDKNKCITASKEEKEDIKFTRERIKFARKNLLIIKEAIKRLKEVSNDR